MKIDRQSRQPGFTLVEMLVVVVIIGILAGFLIPAVGAARRRAMEARIAIEISNMSQAVEAYKLKYGDYPPNFSDRALVKRHILKAWPHITELETFLQYVRNNPPDPAEALVFWLGGFSSNPKRPFTGSGGPFAQLTATAAVANPERVTGVFEFDKGRLNFTDGNDAFPVYAPKGKELPYVYFDSRTYSFIHNGQPAYTRYGRALPYKSNRQNASFNAKVDPPDQMFEFANPTTFQIVSAGLDDDYGAAQMLAFEDLPDRYPPSPYGGATIPVFLNYITNRPFFPHKDFFPEPPDELPEPDPRVNPDFHFGHMDNIGNFTGGGTIEDAEE